MDVLVRKIETERKTETMMGIMSGWCQPIGAIIDKGTWTQMRQMAGGRRPT